MPEKSALERWLQRPDRTLAALATLDPAGLPLGDDLTKRWKFRPLLLVLHFMLVVIYRLFVLARAQDPVAQLRRSI